MQLGQATLVNNSIRDIILICVEVMCLLPIYTQYFLCNYAILSAFLFQLASIKSTFPLDLALSYIYIYI